MYPIRNLVIHICIKYQYKGFGNYSFNASFNSSSDVYVTLSVSAAAGL